jgi:hypothetical protein
MMHTREALEPVYNATTYVVEGPSGTRFSIRIGQRHPDLDSWLATLAAASWAFVTACNPRSEIQIDERNEQAMAEFRAELQAGSYAFAPGYGQGDDLTWPPEPSFLILGIVREEATALAERYGQNAYVYGEPGGSAELVWTSVIKQTHNNCRC